VVCPGLRGKIGGRRDFIGSALAWPLAAHAQQSNQRRVGILALRSLLERADGAIEFDSML
jgi:hypothetical protein